MGMRIRYQYWALLGKLGEEEDVIFTKMDLLLA